MSPRPPRPPASFPPHPGGGLLHLYEGLGDFCQDRALLYQGLHLWTQETGPEARGCALPRRWVEAQETAGGRGLEADCAVHLPLGLLSSPQKLPGGRTRRRQCSRASWASHIGACTNYLWEPLYSSPSAPFGQARPPGRTELALRRLRPRAPQGIRQRWWAPHTGQEDALCWRQDLLHVLPGSREQSLGARPHL